MTDVKIRTIGSWSILPISALNPGVVLTHQGKYYRSFQGTEIDQKVEHHNSNMWDVAIKVSGIDKNAQRQPQHDRPRLNGPSMAVRDTSADCFPPLKSQIFSQGTSYETVSVQSLRLTLTVSSQHDGSFEVRIDFHSLKILALNEWKSMVPSDDPRIAYIFHCYLRCHDSCSFLDSETEDALS